MSRNAAPYQKPTKPFKPPWNKMPPPSPYGINKNNKRVRTQKIDCEIYENNLSDESTTELDEDVNTEILDWLSSIDTTIGAMTTQIELLTQQVTKLLQQRKIALDSWKPKLARQDATLQEEGPISEEEPEPDYKKRLIIPSSECC